MMSKLNGWQRLLLVFAVISAVVCFVVASENAREKRIEVSTMSSNVMRMIAEDSKNLPCQPYKDNIGCGQEVSEITQVAINNLKKANNQTVGLTAKLFFTYWIVSILCFLVLIQTAKFISAGFKKSK